MWDFSDPVVFWTLFTLTFGIGMLIYLYFWVRQKIISSVKETNKSAGTKVSSAVPLKGR